MFYSSLFSLISDVAGDGPKDRPFAVAAMVRSACFGLGGLVAGGLLSSAGPAGYRIAVVADAASFAACSLLLALLVHIPHPCRRPAPAARADGPRPLSDRPPWPFWPCAGSLATCPPGLCAPSTPRIWFPSRHDLTCIRRIGRAAAVVHRGHRCAG